MAVKYDVVFSDGVKLTNEAICFGSMATGAWSFGNSHNLSIRPADQQSFIQFYPQVSQHPTWSHEMPIIKRDWNGNDSYAVKKAANRAYLEEMRLVLADLPMFSDVVSIHPMMGVIRFHLKEHQADKIILAMFLFRNLSAYAEKNYMYRYMRGLGYRPRIAVIVAHLLCIELGSMGRKEFNDQSIGEYNWINPDTFGKQAFINMITQNTDGFTFIQEAWRTQKGYRREREFKFNGNTPVIFDDRYIGYQWDYPRDCLRDYNSTSLNKHKFWNLVDSYSIPNDVPITSLQSWNCVDGFNLFLANHYKPSSEQEKQQDIFNNFLAEIDIICEENGISKI